MFTGNEAASPVRPDLQGKAILASIYLTTGMTEITQSDITDLRGFSIGTDSIADEKIKVSVNDTTEDYLDNKINLNDYKGEKVFLSFFRDASCPFCNIRLNQIIKNFTIFQEKEIKIIAFFASSKKEILKYASDNKNKNLRWKVIFSAYF